MASSHVSLNWFLLKAIAPLIKKFLCTHPMLLQCNVFIIISECSCMWLCNSKQNLPSVMVYFSQNKHVVHIWPGTGHS